jgi:thiol-disulfide isomerase/thioredoxin
MKSRHLILAALLFLYACSAGWQLQVFDPAAQQTHELKPSDVAHKKLVINYWAEWCKPCLQEIPQLDQFAASHRDTVLVLAMNFDHLKEDALHTAIQKADITYPSLITDPSTVFTLPEISGLPTTLILDDQGKVIQVLTGAQTQQSLEAALKL